MAWFKAKLTDKAKDLGTSLASAFAKRAKLATELGSIRPQLTADEFASCWFLFSAKMAKDEAESTADSQNDMSKTLASTTREFFDSFCRDYLNFMLGSDLELKLGSPKIEQIFRSMMEKMSADRAKEVGEVLVGLASNAVELSGATISILMNRIGRDELAAMVDHSLQLIRSSSDLNGYERSLAERWLVQAWAKV